MNRKKVILLICGLVQVFICGAQTIHEEKERKEIARYPFHSITSIGLLEGQQGSALQLQSVNGVQYKKWFGGVGAGIDFYHFRGFPVFIDVRKYVTIRNTFLFAYGDAGIHLPWVKRGEASIWYDSKLTKGLYYDAGLGYRLPVAKKYALVFSGGYSVKEIAEVWKQPIACIATPCPEYQQRFDYTLRRISLRAGWVF
ncbi:MAG: hypothetical protein ICV66_07440 [Chitinophagaceae bacterium]|nr:hypothetical protein [Chitinophagaceae bacterium]